MLCPRVLQQYNNRRCSPCGRPGLLAGFAGRGEISRAPAKLGVPLLPPGASLSAPPLDQRLAARARPAGAIGVAPVQARQYPRRIIRKTEQSAGPPRAGAPPVRSTDHAPETHALTCERVARTYTPNLAFGAWLLSRRQPTGPQECRNAQDETAKTRSLDHANSFPGSHPAAGARETKQDQRATTGRRSCMARHPPHGLGDDCRSVGRQRPPQCSIRIEPLSLRVATKAQQRAGAGRSRRLLLRVVKCRWLDRELL